MGTEFLKTLVLNRPCIYIVQNSELKNLNENALKYFKNLHKNNIVYFNGLNATKFINDNLGNIENGGLAIKLKKVLKILQMNLLVQMIIYIKDLKKPLLI